MASSVRLFGRQRTVHQTLGGGIAADIILWRRRDVSVGILIGALTTWVLFELCGYTLLSLGSNVMLLLFSVLFVWGKAAEILNRFIFAIRLLGVATWPPPPIPEMHIPKDIVYEAATFVQTNLNNILSVSRDVALGKDINLFSRLTKCLLLLSIIGNCTDFLSFACLCLVVLLTLPVLYEKYEDMVDRYVMSTLVKLHMYEIMYEECFYRSKEWILETMKEV